MATKTQILSSVIELSGRTDLAETLWSGMTKGDLFLQAGLKLLDTAQDTPDSKRWLMKDCEVGDHTLQFQNARAIYEVWIANADGRLQLSRVDLNKLRAEYSDPVDELDTDTPKYYSPDVIHIAPEQRALTDATYTDDFTYDYHSILFGESHGYSGIIWMPPTDVIYTVEVLGDWYSVLSDDSDTCYWSIVYPNVLIQATLFAIEVFYRNSQGMKDYLDSLSPFLKGIDHDMANYDAVDLNQMEG